MLEGLVTSRLSQRVQVYDYDMGGKPSYIGNTAVILEPLKNAGVILVPPTSLRVEGRQSRKVERIAPEK